MVPGAATIVRLGLPLAAGVAVGGCFTTTADYREQAEVFIVEDVTIPEEDVAFADATCDEPPNQQPGSTFSCVATDQTGASWEFDVMIEEDNRFVVAVSDRPDR